VARVTGAVPDWLTEARRICVLTGAGVSTDSGIPDYRGPNGMWTRDPDAEKLVTLSYYLTDPDIRRRSWLMRRDLRLADPQPNAAHAALVDLERQGRLRALVTQNIDGLHQRAGSSAGSVLEIHGTVHHVVCVACGDRTSMTSALDRIEAGEPDPAACSAAASSSRRRSTSVRSWTSASSERARPPRPTATSCSLWARPCRSGPQPDSSRSRPPPGRGW
jgi:NAD-dependent SIR2 family protein deacetylase